MLFDGKKDGNCVTQQSGLNEVSLLIQRSSAGEKIQPGSVLTKFEFAMNMK